jgi:hypothetical protein
VANGLNVLKHPTEDYEIQEIEFSALSAFFAVKCFCACSYSYLNASAGKILAADHEG